MHMTQIRSLFDSSRALNRPIEKVITYQNRSDEQLKTEISEYVVTKHIEDSFNDLLGRMQAAQEGGGGHEIGVWVSGFYGSGKSSFTKYLGFSLNREMKIGDSSFLKLLQNRLHTAATVARFNQVANLYDAEVIFLDLASEMIAGASMEDVSTVLYLKVLQWAGYSEDLKVAELERMLERDGKLDAFKKRAKEELDGTDWVEAHNQPLVANPIASRLAAEFYPQIFKSDADFRELAVNVNKAENKRVEEMLDLINKKSGKRNTIFIIDEVGQYVSAKPSLILNLDGLAKNLKDIGKGKAWIFATAQQTLTEDNPTAALNSISLFKLQARFPIQLHLEASDIKEICHKRLLTKSAGGETELNSLFDKSGASLRTATQLADAGVYEAELTKKTFVDLYPFLPAHFEILLQLLGRLAKKTGGLGLRSAIKVVQEVLVERGHEQSPLADGTIGQLANTVTFYNSLRRDIMRSFPYVVEGVELVEQRLPNEALCIAVAKSIAVLQILENLPVTVQNIAALMQPDVTSSSLKEQVEAAVHRMLQDGMIPLGEKNGGLRFLTQAAVTLQHQFERIEYRNVDLKNEQNGILRAIFKPLPSVRLEQSRPVTAGLKVMMGGGQSSSLEGEKEPIQLHVEFASAASYETTRKERETDSMSTKERSSIFLLGRIDQESEKQVISLVRCRKFLEGHRTTSDPDTQEFVRMVDQRLQRTAAELERVLSESLLKGSLIAHGAHEAVSSRGIDVLEATKSFLGDAAAKVFDRYSEAPYIADTSLAEKFLTTPLDRITSNEDPLGLVTRIAGGRPQIKVSHKAIISLIDYLRLSGQVDGRRLLDHFAAPPFGWSKDTIRYLLTAAFLGGEIKLRIAGKDHQVKSDESIEAFASNRAFGSVGVSLREVPVDPEELVRASDRLRNLTGDDVLLLEDVIAATAKRQLPQFQAAFGPLAVELRSLELPQEHIDKLENLASDLAEILGGDGSDAVKRLGGQESSLYESLLWARNLKKALDNGLRKTLSHITRIRAEFVALPDSGLPAKLKESAGDSLESISEILHRDCFFDETSVLATASADIDQLVSETVTELAKQQDVLALRDLDRWQTSADWRDLQNEDRSWFTDQVSRLHQEATPDLNGLKKLLSRDFEINHTLRELGEQVAKRSGENRRLREDAAKAKAKAEGRKEIKEETVLMPSSLETADQLQELIKQLSSYLEAMRAGGELRVRCRLIEESGTSQDKKSA